jgi:hypothetical protein
MTYIINQIRVFLWEYIWENWIVALFGSMVTVAFQNIFRAEMH